MTDRLDAGTDADVEPLTEPAPPAPADFDDFDDTPLDGPRVVPVTAAEPSVFTRIVRRVFRRPIEWANRPWTNTRIVQFVVTIATLTTTTVIMTNVVHLSIIPSRDLIFDDTTPTGGDFGAHVWGPAYLRDHLLPSGWFNGWTMDWYAGMPAYRFYMVLPAFMILLADLILKYGIAMKLVSIVGVVTLPISCWAFGRLAKFRHPVPELMAFGGLAFVLDESFSIYGGNVKSTMAGEFSFSIALSLAVLALGVLAAGLETGRFRVWAAVLIAAAGVSHGIVLIYIAGAALIFSLVWADRQRIRYAATVDITAVLLMMWWVGPFLLNHAYMTDMKYGARPDGAEDSFWDMFFPLDTVLDFIVTALAVLGFAMSIARRQLNGAALGVTCLLFVALTYLTRDSLPVIGLLWNPRLLPFIYLLRYLLMAVGAFELFTLLWNAFRDRRALTWPSVGPATSFVAISALAILVVLGWLFQELPGGRLEVKRDGQKAVYTWGPFSAPQRTDQTHDAQADGWARYNFLGYEGRGSYYTEYHQVVSTMSGIGANPAHGCGRAMWENHSDNGQYGTTMALMLLPFWTDGCIGSMEGLFFEASGTTPYHFLTAAAMSENSSNPVRELRYTDNDADVGVRYLQQLGVRYVMVRTDAAKREAADQPELTLIAQSAPWDIYQVAGSDIVMPLDVQPVVVNPRPGDPRERNLELGTSWFQNPGEWAAMPADDGPDEWQRIDVAVDGTRHLGEDDAGGPRVDIVRPFGQIEAVPLPAVTVSNVELDHQSLSFDVDRPGVPVLVRVSYFPNWNASGAEGPYRIGPNMMVVVPTDTHVEMSYGRTFSDYATVLMTLAGIGLCVFWRRRGDTVFDDLVFGDAAFDDQVFGDQVFGGTAAPSHDLEPDDEPFDLAELDERSWREPDGDNPPDRSVGPGDGQG